MSLADLMKKGSLRRFATVTGATVATDKPFILSSVATVATVSVAATQKQAANDPAAAMPDPDRWCWPHSSAMSGREIDTMVERTNLFNRRGLPSIDAERLADKLVTRDRESDDRRLCLECLHLGRNGLCRAVTVGSKLIAPVPTILQRCDSFAAQL